MQSFRKSIFLILMITGIPLRSSAESRKPLIFENRAACALDSKLPADSALLIVDSYNAGKLVDSWLKGLEPNISANMNTEKGLRYFRLAVTEMFMTLASEILNGRLPLISSDDEIIKRCQGQTPCPEMEMKLDQVFQAWTQISAVPNVPLQGASVSCLYLRKFSEFQAPWNRDRPDQSVLQKLAQDTLNSKDLVSECFDESESLSSRRFALQFDLNGQDPRWWSQHGFDFWFSLKLYFSYSWRNPTYILGETHPLLGLFRSLAVEQMMSLVSNTCKSIEKPVCTESQTALEVYRLIARAGAPADLDHPFSRGADQALLAQAVPVYHEDVAVLPEGQEAGVWLKSYQDQILKNRGFLKQKLLSAVSLFELMKSALPVEDLQKGLLTLRSQIQDHPLLYKKMQVLCSEDSLAFHPLFGVMEKKLEGVVSDKSFEMLFDSISNQQLRDLVSYGVNVGKMIEPLCEQIKVEQLWAKGKEPEAADLSAWYRDLMGNGDSGSNDFFGLGNLFNQDAMGLPAVLSQERSTDSGTEKSTVCSDVSDCGRLILKTLVDLNSISTWTSALTPMKEWIQSPSLANPWATEQACKLYDPWYATHRAFVAMVGDLFTTTVTGIAPIPAYLAIDLKPSTVTGFQPEPLAGDVLLHPNLQRGGVSYSLGIDLGPWTGIPCAAIVSPNAIGANTNGFYTLGGVRAEACMAQNSHRLTVTGASDSNANPNAQRSSCLMCYLNPYSTARSLSMLGTTPVPLLRLAAGVVFSGVSLIKKLSDPVDVPRRFTVDPAKVAATFQKYSFIPKHCVRRLIHGHSCRWAWLTADERKHEPVEE